MKKALIALSALVFCITFSCKPPQSTCIDPAKANPDLMCTMQYDPVCGCDNKTYGNACEAGRAGVTSYIKGACPDQQ